MTINPENLADMPLDPGGIAAAVASIGEDRRLDDDTEQAELFASSPLLANVERAADLVPVGRRGRKPGSLNTTTEAWRSYFLRNYRSPLLFLGDLYSVDPFEFAKAIREADRAAGIKRDVSVLDVVNLQKGAAADLAPYLHRKQPIAIDGGEDKPVPLIQQLLMGADAINTLFPQRAGNAEVLDVVPAQVAGEKSHDAAEGEPSA